MAIEMQEVKSSMFSHAAYIESTWSLIVRFRSTGLQLAYQNVPPELADEFLSAKSLGHFYNENIKKKFEAVGDEAGPPPKKKEQSQPPADESFLTDEDLEFLDHPPQSKSIPALPPFGVPDSIPEGLRELPVHPDDAEPISALATQAPTGEILGAWEPPKDAKEAITLLSEREREINAIIAANKMREIETSAITVTDAASHAEAGEALKTLVDAQDKTTKLLDPFRALLYASYQLANERKTAALTPLANAVTYLKRQMLTWSQSEERKRQEAIAAERRRAEEEARQRQEAETQRLTMAEMQDRIEQGDEAGAEKLLFEPIEAPRPAPIPQYIPPAVTKPSGVSTTTKWKVCEQEIETDEAYAASIRTLLKAVKDESYDLNTAATHLKWDLVKLNKLAGALQGAFRVPGLNAAPDTSMSVRRGKKG